METPGVSPTDVYMLTVLAEAMPQLSPRASLQYATVLSSKPLIIWYVDINILFSIFTLFILNTCSLLDIKIFPRWIDSIEDGSYPITSQ